MASRREVGRAAAWIASLSACAGGLLLGTGGAGSAVVPEPAGAVEGMDLVRFGRDVRPVLADRCFTCHGADAAARQGGGPEGLRLDTRDGAIADLGGRVAITPGSPEHSELWSRVTSADPDYAMPPPSAGRAALSPEELETLRRWIVEGAPYEAHWSFEPPRAPPVPAPRREQWCRDEIDRFVLSALERRGIEPSPEADEATLLRRMFLDLTGLPPTLEELDAFLADPSPAAYEAWVDRVLTEEPYASRVAERLATPWLDAARYADTIGIHTDNGRQMWVWRDWVLRALRDNMPYDRFITEQLAGDLIPGATIDQRIASGFNRNHVATDEGGAIAEEYLVEYAVDRVDTTSAVFLGLTMGCARCHDHKFDPITQGDYYGLAAMFNSIEEPGLYSQTADARRAYEPFIDVPTPEQREALAALDARIAALTRAIETPAPGEAEERARFMREVRELAGVRWTTPPIVEARASAEGVGLEPLGDGSLAARGPAPDSDAYSITLRVDEPAARLLLVEALRPGPNAPGPGRAPNGNAVVTDARLERRDAGGAWTPVPLRWALADHEQQNGDFQAVNVLDDDPQSGWALDLAAHGGSRLLLLLADAPFGGGEARLTLAFESIYTQHTLARVRVSTSPLADAGEERLPLSLGRWWHVGPFPADREEAWSRAFGPELEESLDAQRAFAPGGLLWQFRGDLADARANVLSEGTSAQYVGRAIRSPTARRVPVSLGSDDGFRLYVNGEEVASRRVDRGVAPDQDPAELPLRAGLNTVVMKIVNTGGAAGFYFRADQEAPALVGPLACAILDAGVLTEAQRVRLESAWRRAHAPAYRAAEADRTAASAELERLRADIPRAMVMKELPQPRPTFVLRRGVYDAPDTDRPVERAVPAALGRLSPGEPRDRLGLARWMTGEDNPLVARVAVNRFWELLFGHGLVRTSEDFGVRGEWPTHPELLDWLAVDLRAHGWDVRRLLRRIVLSSTYRQSSRGRDDLAALDPENRLLARYPRRRLSGEQIRDLALHASGLLVERFGGPPVKPYQPDGLWREVAMLQSNTREYARGEGEDLWRRSVYTYWKRASPPPSMLTFDAPTRESCVVRRTITGSPLQALVVWNDEQFVEAARVLAERTLLEPGPDRARAESLFRRCAARSPEPAEVGAMLALIDAMRARYRGDPAAAAALVAVGERPPAEGLEPAEVAAWTMAASAVLALHETVTQR